MTAFTDSAAAARTIGFPDPARDAELLRDGRRIGFLDPAAVIPRTQLTVQQAREAAQRVARVEPADRVLVADEAKLDNVTEAFARVIDAKSPWTYDHSNGVARVMSVKRMAASAGPERGPPPSLGSVTTPRVDPGAAGLAAATGFRVFVPLLIMGLAARSGSLPVSDSFLWVASTPALAALGRRFLGPEVGRVQGFAPLSRRAAGLMSPMVSKEVGA